MVVARQIAFCCVALALLLGGLPSLGAAGDGAAGQQVLTPCHADTAGPGLHDTDCALGCDSNPTPEFPSLDWAPASTRLSDDEVQGPAALAPDYRLHSLGPRAPPGLPAATPVARYDILRD
jgi:hypothetical protein